MCFTVLSCNLVRKELAGSTWLSYLQHLSNFLSPRHALLSSKFFSAIVTGLLSLGLFL